MKNKPKMGRTVVLLYPELLKLNNMDWIAKQLGITQGDIVQAEELDVDPIDLDWLCSTRNLHIRRAANKHLVGKTIRVLILKGYDIIERTRKVVGVQQNPEDWTINTIRGKLRSEFDLETIEMDNGRKYHCPYIECSLTTSSAKRVLGRLQTLFPPRGSSVEM